MIYPNLILEAILQKQNTLYHLSDINHDGEIFKPRIPYYEDPDWNGEDTKTPRISFGGTIQDCLKSVPFRLVRYVWYVHSPVNPDPKYIHKVTNDEVYDAKTTNEIWYLKPVKLKLVDVIFVYDKKHSKYVSLSNTNYEMPYSHRDILKRYGVKKFHSILGHFPKNGNPDNLDKRDTPGQQCHMWRALTGLEMIHKEPDMKEQMRIYNNWKSMLPQMKKISDTICKEIFGCDNLTNHENIMRDDWGYYTPSGAFSFFYKARVNGKEVGKYGLSFYEDIKAVGIGSLEIYPQYRNKGYGTKVIKEIVDKYKKDYDLIYCFVDSTNIGAIRFYKRIGKVSTTLNKNKQYMVTLYKR